MNSRGCELLLLCKINCFDPDPKKAALTWLPTELTKVFFSKALRQFSVLITRLLADLCCPLKNHFAKQPSGKVMHTAVMIHLEFPKILPCWWRRKSGLSVREVYCTLSDSAVLSPYKNPFERGKKAEQEGVS
jgi:hypothetical protein